jgi:hypothetical protein
MRFVPRRRLGVIALRNEERHALPARTQDSVPTGG